MKWFVGLCGLVFVGVTGWQLGGRLSSDAIGMALGVLFGIMAGIPAALMVLAARRHEDSDSDARRSRPQYGHGYGGYPQFPSQQQPPVIVVTGQGPPPAQSEPYPADFGERAAHFLGSRERQTAEVGQRTFRVIGQDDGQANLW